MTESERSALVALIRREFPDFLFKRVTSVRAGENHTAIILDDAWVFRFPKSDAYRLAFPRQAHFLDRLAPLTPLRIPRYEFVSKDDSFGGYPLIKGKELTAKRFKRLEKDVQKKVVRTLADFLRVLHKLPTSYLPDPRPEEGYWDPDHVWKYTERYRTTRRSLIKKHVSKSLLEQIDAFFPSFEELVAPVKRITHGDLRDAHILFDKGQVSGINEVDYTPLAINAFFHPLLLLLLTRKVGFPGEDNTEAVIAGVQNMIHGKVKPLMLKESTSGNSFIFGFVYFCMTVGVFGAIVSILQSLNFNWLGGTLFLFFLALVTYFAFRIRYRANAWRVTRDERPLTVLGSLLATPVIRVGRWLSRTFSSINIVVMVMDFILETPFRYLLDFSHQFIRYLREKADDVY